MSDDVALKRQGLLVAFVGVLHPKHHLVDGRWTVDPWWDRMSSGGKEGRAQIWNRQIWNVPFREGARKGIFPWHTTVPKAVTLVVPRAKPCRQVRVGIGI